MYEPALMAAGDVEAGLASTGLMVGSMALFIIGGIFIVVGLFVLLKRNSINRP